MRAVGRIAGGLLLVVITSCRDSAAPELGALRINIEASGQDIDSDGYTLTIDGTETNIQGTSAVIPGLPAGPRQVGLSGHAVNCHRFPASRQVTVVANDTVDVDFDVTCTLAIGRIVIAFQGIGMEFDADGFTISLDQGAALKTGVKGAVNLDSIRVGPHTVHLGGLAANCTAAQLQRSVTVAFGTSVPVTFEITCSPVFGMVRIRAATTGQDLDPDGYGITFEDDLPDVTVGVNAETLVQKRVGAHTIRLYDVFPNCTVGGTPSRAISVAEDQITDVVFEVACDALAALRVNVTTTGSDPDPNGYLLTVAGTPTEYTTAVAISTVVTIPRLLAGEHNVALGNVAANCDLSAANPRAVTLVGGATTDVIFDIVCTTAGLLAFTKSVNGNDDIFTIRSNGTSETRLTTRDGPDVEPSFSPDGGRIAFRSGRDGNDEIYVMSSAGADQTRVTSFAQSDFAPRWSPLGNRIVFARWVSDGDADILLMDPDGANATNITNTPGVDEHPSWSPDGSKIAFRSERGGNSDIYVMNADGSNAVRLTTDSNWEGQPTWSPDGKQIAFVRSACDYVCVNNIHVMNADGTNVVRIASELDESEPAWAPDGSRIAFVSRVCDYYYYYYCSAGTLTIMKPDGTSRTDVVSGALYNPVWRP